MYLTRTKDNLPIYGVKPKILKEFTTTKADLKKGVSRVPLELSRLQDEDTAMQVDRTASEIERDEMEAEMAQRMQAFQDAQRRASQLTMDGNVMNRTQRGNTLYAAKGNAIETTLDDFDIKQVLGQGSFGKVYLVEHKATKKIYAMKSIRKDVVIEHEQLDNLRLEKHILLCVEHPFLVSMEFVFQKESRIYFLMNFVKGGELFKHLTDVRRFDEDRAKFYAA